MNDPDGKPSLPLGMACFMGFSDIVRELIQSGARANFPDNTIPTSPLSMAVRGKRTDVVRLLIEMGVDLPPGIETGLTEQEITIAHALALQNAASNAASGKKGNNLVVEEIDVIGCYGTDTQILEADVIRAAQRMNEEKTKDNKS
ncbi:MAG: ankyrin repeat domain-containing protein [Candidatus Accumulibacter sp.]|nr:ankyrin repeat domain-containing protein [Accumulibacter sp.]